MVNRYARVTPAIGAQTFAVWKMNVNADSVFFVRFAECFFNFLFPLFKRKIIFPIRNGGITGISWGRGIIFFYERIHCFNCLQQTILNTSWVFLSISNDVILFEMVIYF